MRPSFVGIPNTCVGAEEVSHQLNPVRMKSLVCHLREFFLGIGGHDVVAEGKLLARRRVSTDPDMCGGRLTPRSLIH